MALGTPLAKDARKLSKMLQLGVTGAKKTEETVASGGRNLSDLGVRGMVVRQSLQLVREFHGFLVSCRCQLQCCTMPSIITSFLLFTGGGGSR